MHYLMLLRIYLAILRKFVLKLLGMVYSKLVTRFSALTCIILILSSPWKDTGEEVEVNVLLKVPI